MTDQNVIVKTDLPLGLVPDWLDRVRIRHAEKADLPEMEWDGEYSRFRRIYAEVYRRSQRGLAVMWVADLSCVGVIGQVFVQLISEARLELADGCNRAYVHSFRVLSAYRRAGLGAWLMEVVEADLLRRGYHEITLNVTRTNAGARRLYERLGYYVTDSDPGRWSYFDENNIIRHVHEPGWRMIKEIGR
jgi:ribosomal protein S18 acetylase RimI-like enzyme